MLLKETPFGTVTYLFVYPLYLLVPRKAFLSTGHIFPIVR